MLLTLIGIHLIMSFLHASELCSQVTLSSSRANPTDLQGQTVYGRAISIFDSGKDLVNEQVSLTNIKDHLRLKYVLSWRYDGDATYYGLQNYIGIKRNPPVVLDTDNANIGIELVNQGRYRAYTWFITALTSVLRRCRRVSVSIDWLGRIYGNDKPVFRICGDSLEDLSAVFINSECAYTWAHVYCLDDRHSVNTTLFAVHVSDDSQASNGLISECRTEMNHHLAVQLLSNEPISGKTRVSDCSYFKNTVSSTKASARVVIPPYSVPQYPPYFQGCIGVPEVAYSPDITSVANEMLERLPDIKYSDKPLGMAVPINNDELFSGSVPYSGMNPMIGSFVGIDSAYRAFKENQIFEVWKGLQMLSHATYNNCSSVIAMQPFKFFCSERKTIYC